MIDIIIENGLDAAEKSFIVRKAVFIDEQKVPEEIEMDEYDKEAVFANLYEDEVIKATARYVVINGEHLIGRVAVLKEERGRGFGEGVMSIIMDEIFAKNVHEIHIHAQITAEPFYKKLGFQRYGEEYDEAGIPHVNMKVIKKR